MPNSLRIGHRETIEASQATFEGSQVTFEASRATVEESIDRLEWTAITGSQLEWKVRYSDSESDKQLI